MDKRENNRGIILGTLFLTFKNIWRVLGIVIIFYILLNLISAGILYGGVGITKINSGTLPSMSVIVIIGIALIGGLIQVFTDASVADLINTSMKGEKRGIFRSIKNALKKFLRVVGAAIIIGVISLITGFLGTVVIVMFGTYVGSDSTILSAFLTAVIAIIGGLITAFIIPGIMIDDKRLFESFKYNFKLLFKTDGKVILKVIGLLIVAFIVISLSYLLTIIPYVQNIAPYIIVLIGQLALVFIEVGIVDIYNTYKSRVR
ncbi:MAG: hypothetical protein ACRDDL_00415 [Sarcina sp.]